MNQQESIAWIEGRKSIYPAQFDPAASISPKQLREMFEAARFAPTHKITQPWRFKAFMGGGKNTFVKLVEEAMIAEGSPSEQRDHKLAKLSAKAQRSAAIVAIIMERDLHERIPEWEEVCAVACAVQNVALHMKSMGWAGYWSTGGMCNAETVRASMSLKPADLHLGWFFIGKPLEEGKRGNRKSVDSILEIVE